MLTMLHDNETSGKHFISFEVFLKPLDAITRKRTHTKDVMLYLRLEWWNKWWIVSVPVLIHTDQCTRKVHIQKSKCALISKLLTNTSTLQRFHKITKHTLNTCSTKTLNNKYYLSILYYIMWIFSVNMPFFSNEVILDSFLFVCRILNYLNQNAHLI
jgi:hypothetical protein